VTSSYGPEWQPLFRALRRLATASRASLAFVVDTGNVLWCAAPALAALPDPATENLAASEVYGAEIEPRVASLRRGERFEVSRDEWRARYHARSFASTYVLAVWFEARRKDFTARASTAHMGRCTHTVVGKDGT